jgi:hypothetical protein
MGQLVEQAELAKLAGRATAEARQAHRRKEEQAHACGEWLGNVTRARAGSLELNQVGSKKNHFPVTLYHRSQH